VRRYLAGTRALVHAPEQAAHRHLSDVQSIIESSVLAAAQKQRAIHIFTLLAEAEGRVHGIPADQVHFHEVGALDAIVDIVGVVAGLALLGIQEVYASALPLGAGWTRAAHGALPLPAPAVLALLAGVHAPTIPDDTPFELVTPTGAAILAGLAEFRRPPLRLNHIGYGLGARDLERPNVLRVWLGETATSDQVLGIGNVSVRNSQSPISNPQSPILLETNIDDQPAEQLAYVVEQLFALGALDAWLASIQMKKGRAATLLSALVPAALEDAAVALLMRETTTLGLRRRVIERHVAERESVTVETPLGLVRVKRKRWHGQDLGAAPEYEDCARLAREHGIALREVYQMALEELRVAH
jgi:pyridinium-3,5-bisthiocarboxylic acid mononucleotide nickel chelatase